MMIGKWKLLDLRLTPQSQKEIEGKEEEGR